MSDVTKPKNRGGRPPSNPEGKKPPALSFRARDGLREKLEAGAKSGDRSISEEIERMLGLAYDLAASPVDDFMVRTILNAIRSTAIITERDWRTDVDAGQLAFSAVSGVLTMIFAQTGAIKPTEEIDRITHAAGMSLGVREFKKAMGRPDEEIELVGAAEIKDFIRRDVERHYKKQFLQQFAEAQANGTIAEFLKEVGAEDLLSTIPK